MTKTVTVNIDDEINRKFREAVIKAYGNKKGNISRAVEDAFKLLMNDINTKNADSDLLNRLNKGYNLGGIIYNTRDELHER